MKWYAQNITVVYKSQLSTEDIKYGYCTEFMVKLEADKVKEHNFSEQKFREDISVYGDSLLVVSDDEIVKSSYSCRASWRRYELRTTLR